MKIDPIIVGIIIVTIIIFGGIFLSDSFSQGPSVVQYKITDQDRPQLEISKTAFDFGKTKLDEIKTQEIIIKNKGVKPLTVYDAITSCDCTFAQFVINGAESPKFSMHRNLKWRGEIASGDTAILRIIYEPKIMPVKGNVKREIVFKTNDPQNPLINIRFTAEVE